LVVGDIVEVKFGDRIPADMRILVAHSFKVTGFLPTSDDDDRQPFSEMSHDVVNLFNTNVSID